MRHLNKHKGLLLIIVLAAVSMAGIVAVDEQWTTSLQAHKWPLLEQWMNSSIFDGKALGANDPVVFYLLGVILMYYTGWRFSNLKQITPLRPQCGFVLTSAVTGAVCLVHSLKWVVGRARPGEVFLEGWPYSHWFAFGPHFVTEGVYHGSFPSGHTAQVFILMSIAYALAGDPFNGRWIRAAGWIWGAFCVGLSLAMAAARCMSQSHWIADSLGSILFGWALMHLLYFHILKVPDQQHYIRTRGRLPALPPVWEIVLCAYICIGMLGITAVLLGAKAVVVHQGPWLVLMVPIGAGLIWMARQRAACLLYHVWKALDLRKT